MKTTYSKHPHTGNKGETIAGNWLITTSKRSSGILLCSAVLCDEIGEGMLRYTSDSQRLPDIANSRARATTQEIKRLHQAGLDRFLELHPEFANPVSSSSHQLSTLNDQPLPVKTTPECSPASLSRPEIIANPIPWLRQIDADLRHLCNNHPSGGQWITDYLEMVDADDYQRYQDAEDAKCEAESKLEDAETEVADLTKLVKSIISSLESGTFESIDATANTLESIAFAIDQADLSIPFNYSDTSGRIEIFGQTESPEKDETELHDMRAAWQNAYNRTIELEAELAAATSALTSASLSDLCASAVPSSPILTRNGDKNGIELRFPVKPDTETLAALKMHGFRWSGKQPGQPWWVKYSEEAWVFAASLTERGIHPATGSAGFNPAFIHSSSSGPGIEIAATEASPERHEEESHDSSLSTLNSQLSTSSTAFADF